jgi:hypothetical protein
MMKTVFKFFLYLLLFIIAFFVFLPKELLYNQIEKALEQNKIVVSNEIRDEKLFGLDIKNADIYFNGINMANVNKISFTSYLFYTNIDITDIRLLDSLKNMVPTPINKLKVEHSVLNLDKLSISSTGLFGSAKGFVDLKKREVQLEIDASSKMKNSYSQILRTMKLKDGKYIYDYKF